MLFSSRTIFMVIQLLVRCFTAALFIHCLSTFVCQRFVALGAKSNAPARHYCGYRLFLALNSVCYNTPAKKNNVHFKLAMFDLLHPRAGGHAMLGYRRCGFLLFYYPESLMSVCCCQPCDLSILKQYCPNW